MNSLSGKAGLIARAGNGIAQVNAGDSSGIDSISSSDSSHSNLPPSAALQAIQVLDFKNTEIKDIVRGLATKYNLNNYIDDAIAQRVIFSRLDRNCIPHCEDKNNSLSCNTVALFIGIPFTL